MSGLKMHFLVAVALLLPLAAASAAPPAGILRATPVASTADGECLLAPVAALNPWSRKFHKHKPALCAGVG